MRVTSHPSAQRGIGMVEVLVALLLLAVGVLGFSALQSYAVYSTTESLNRTQALTVMRGLAERIRVNGTTPAILENYRQNLMSSGEPLVPSELCRSSGGSATGCDATQLAVIDAYDARAAAWDSGIQLGMAACPATIGIGQRQCLLAAWDDTTPTIAAGDDACMTLDGIYRRQANCIVMEIY